MSKQSEIIDMVCRYVDGIDNGHKSVERKRFYRLIESCREAGIYVALRERADWAAE